MIIHTLIDNRRNILCPTPFFVTIFTQKKQLNILFLGPRSIFYQMVTYQL